MAEHTVSLTEQAMLKPKTKAKAEAKTAKDMAKDLAKRAALKKAQKKKAAKAAAKAKKAGGKHDGKKKGGTTKRKHEDEELDQGTGDHAKTAEEHQGSQEAASSCLAEPRTLAPAAEPKPKLADSYRGSVLSLPVAAQPADLETFLGSGRHSYTLPPPTEKGSQVQVLSGGQVVHIHVPMSGQR